MSLKDFWKEQIESTRADLRKPLVSKEEVVMHALDNKLWEPGREDKAKIARKQLDEAMRSIGYTNEHGDFVRTAYAVQVKGQSIIGSMKDAPASHIRQFIDEQIKRAQWDAHQVVVLVREIERKRNIKVRLPQWILDAASEADEGETAA